MASFLREDSPGAGITKEVWQQEEGRGRQHGNHLGHVPRVLPTGPRAQPQILTDQWNEVSPLSLYR